MNRRIIDNLIRTHQPYGAIIDTNLLLLYIVGKVEPSLIASFRRTRKYSSNALRRKKHEIRHC
jgi:hypothetical protein